jgi:hypothetical protein
MDYIALLQTYINIKAVVAAIVFTQFVKYWLPPATSGGKFSVRVGPYLSRIVPFLPVVFGFVVTYFLDLDSSYTAEDAFQGVMSGTFAAYTYRTTKALIFGE